jgi:hypothetical protein
LVVCDFRVFFLWLLVVCCWLLVVGCLLSVVDRRWCGCSWSVVVVVLLVVLLV